MNKQELIDKSGELLELITTSLREAKDFSLEQLPDVIYQYLLFYQTWYTATAVLTLTLAGFSIYWIKLWFKKAETHPEFSSKREGCQIVGSLGLLSLAVGAFSFLINLHNLILVWTAPKVFLLQQVFYLFKT